MLRTLGAAVLAACLIGFTASGARAQSNPVFVPLPPAAGALYKPDSGPAPHVALVVMHRTANYMTHPACTELSKRGFTVLCMNSRFVNNEAQVRWEQIALDVRAGVEFLRRQPGIAKVVLFGHSGGGPTMSFYQAVAENGVAFCQGPGKFSQCGPELAGLPPADGIVFADAHPGQPVMVMRALIPDMPDETNPPTGQVDSSLDPLDPANGYNKDGLSHYSPAFQQRYFEAQARRMNAIAADAVARTQAIAAGQYGYADDDVVILPRAGNPGAGPAGSFYLQQADPSIARLNSTVRPEKFLHNDGTITTEIVHSVIVPDPDIRRTALSFDLGTKVLNLKSFLSANAIRATDSVDQMDFCSSNNSTVCAVRAISVPVTFAAMGGFVLIRDGELEFENTASKDKDFVVIEGATHGFTGCQPCEKTPGQYANSFRNFFDYVRDWLNARY